MNETLILWSRQFLKSCLSVRMQKVMNALYELSYQELVVKFGLSQALVLRPLLFLIGISDPQVQLTALKYYFLR